MNTDPYAQMLSVTSPLREPVLCSAIQALNLPPGSHGLDAGCGLGFQTILLAKAIGSSGHITGLDISPEFIINAKEIVEKAGLSSQISFQEGEVNRLPFDNDTFDWAWSVDCIGYAPIDPFPLLKELNRVVKPGGDVAILAWSSETLLPGHPLLEAHLKATSSGIAPFTIEKNSELHFLRALGWFRQVGLEELSAQTFVGGVHSPLTEEIYNALAALIQMRWPGVKHELTKELWAEYQRLCTPESPDFILNNPDYYAFFTYSMFHGKVSE